MFFLFLIPGVQTYTAKKITDNINETYGTQIDIESIRISINTDIRAENATVLDHKNDTLINLGRLSTSLFQLPRLLFNNNLDLSGTDIEDLTFNMVKYEGETNNNLNVFLDKFRSKDTIAETTEPFALHIDDVFMTNSSFKYVDYNLNNPESFSIENLTLDLEDINVIDGDVSLNINSLSGKTGYGIQIDRLKTKFFYNESRMQLSQLLFVTPYSDLSTNLTFSYEDGDMSDFENKVQIEASFNNSIVSTSDLKNFYEEFGLGHKFNISGDLSGTLNEFTLNNGDVSGISDSSISGDLRFFNAVDSEYFQLETDQVDIITNYEDLRRLLPNVFGDNAPLFIKRLGKFSLSGKTYLNTDDIDAELYLKSNHGEGIVNIDFKNINDQDNVQYKGLLDLQDLNLGKLTESASIGLATFKLNVDGKGFTEESLNTEAKGQIKSVTINNYTYENIIVDGNLKYPLFDGKLESLDPNFLFNFEGLVDASQDIKTYKFTSEVKYADLYKLNFIEKDSISIFKGKLKLDLKANTIDDAVGVITFEDFNYLNSYERYRFQDFTLTSQVEDGNKLIELSSPDLINGRLYGKFTLSKLPSFIEFSLRNLYFKNVERNQFENKNVNFEFEIYNKIVEAFFPDLSIAPNTFLRGNITSNKDDLEIKFSSPKIQFKENVFNNVDFQINEQNPFFDTYLSVGELNNSLYSIKNFNLINVKLNDTLFFRSEFEGLDNTDDFKLSFYQTYDKEDNTVVGLQKSNIKFKDREWLINQNSSNQNNKIILESGLQNFVFDSIMVSHKDQYIKLTGEVRDSTYKDINLKLKDVSLNNLTPFIDSLNLEGKINGDINIFQKDKLYSPNLEVLIEDFSVNAVNYGNLELKADGNKNLTDFNIDAQIYNSKKKFFEAHGKITTAANNQTINMKTKLNELDISSLSPLGEDVLNQLRGTLSGSADVVGDLNNPDVNGEINLRKAGLKIPYLNVDFDFRNNSKILLDKKRFVFQDILVTDTKYKTNGVLSGFISHNKFSNWELNLSLDSNNIVTLDTAYDEESLYYGTAFISGGAKITGPTDNLEISVDATSQPNTVFNIPLSDTETVGDYTFIYFLTPQDKLNKEQGKDYIFQNISGLNLNFDLKINKNALIEVVIDKESGSKLKGRGDGDLRLEINTNGKFEMFGDFVALDGEYIYKYQGIIEKKFDVVPGGYLSWDGNPIEANMDIQAKSRTDANPTTLLENPSMNREIPVEVIISLKGDLMKPDIKFDLEYPNLSSIIESELDFRIQGEENKEIQALSLVVQGAFYNTQGGGFNSIGSNLVAERATSILDKILQDEEGKFNIGVDYVQAERTPNQNAVGSDRVGLKVQTQLSDRVFINGRFGVPVGGQTESFVFGDVEISFLLNESGSLRGIIFNRESDIQFIGEELGYAQGVGIKYTIDFETFGELIRTIWGIEEDPVKKPKTPSGNNKSLIPDYIEIPE